MKKTIQIDFEDQAGYKGYFLKESQTVNIIMKIKTNLVVS